jgi:hypothetical protein
MASIVASFVLSGIEVIARAGNPLPERRAEAAQRISQFDTDLAASGRPAGMVEERRNQLRAMLEEAAGNPNRPSDERSVYRNALDRLTGADGAPEKSPAGAELGGNGNNEMTAESRHRIDAMPFAPCQNVPQIRSSKRHSRPSPSSMRRSPIV